MNTKYRRSGLFVVFSILAFAPSAIVDPKASATEIRTVAREFARESIASAEGLIQPDSQRPGTKGRAAAQRLYPGTNGGRRWDEERQEMRDRARRARSVSTIRELESLAAQARTPADHLALQEYLKTLEKQYDADAAWHANMAASYIGTRIAWAAVHCELLANRAREAARQARDAAAEQERLALTSK